MQARDAEIAKEMKLEHERASSALRQKQIEDYQANVRHQQELERQLEVRFSRSRILLSLLHSVPDFFISNPFSYAFLSGKRAKETARI